MKVQCPYCKESQEILLDLPGDEGTFSETIICKSCDYVVAIDYSVEVQVNAVRKADCLTFKDGKHSSSNLGRKQDGGLYCMDCCNDVVNEVDISTESETYAEDMDSIIPLGF